MSALTWTRGKAETTYHMGGGDHTVNHTTHSATLTSGDRIVITSVDDLFFLDINAARAGHYPTLRDAKAAVQRREDAQQRVES